MTHRLRNSILSPQAIVRGWVSLSLQGKLLSLWWWIGMPLCAHSYIAFCKKYSVASQSYRSSFYHHWLPSSLLCEVYVTVNVMTPVLFIVVLKGSGLDSDPDCVNLSK